VGNIAKLEPTGSINKSIPKSIRISTISLSFIALLHHLLTVPVAWTTSLAQLLTFAQNSKPFVRELPFPFIRISPVSLSFTALLHHSSTVPVAWTTSLA
jgi:hypothetical protein